MKKITLLVLGLLAFNQVDAQYSKELQLKYVTELSSDAMKGRKFGSPENRLAAELIAEKFKQNKLKPCVGDSFLIEFEHNGKVGQNVCGIKVGQSKDIYAFGAHFDHVGTDSSKEDSIYNGEDDNASGTSAVMALTDFFRKNKTKQTLMFMAFDAEEIGIVGSKKIADNKDFQQYLPNMKVMLNMEMIGTISAFGEGKVYMTGSDRSDLMDLMNKNAEGDFQVVSDPYLKEQLFYRSDNVSFVNHKVVSHSLSTVDMNNQNHYHRKNDEIGVIKVDNLTKITEGIGKTMLKMMKQNEAPTYFK